MQLNYESGLFMASRQKFYPVSQNFLENAKIFYLPLKTHFSRLSSILLMSVVGYRALLEIGTLLATHLPMIAETFLTKHLYTHKPSDTLIVRLRRNL